MTVFSAFWAFAMIAACAATIVCAYVLFQPRQFGWGQLGILTRYGSPVIVQLMSEDARASGIRVGDTLLSLNGMPVERDAGNFAAIGAALPGEEGSLTAVTVRDSQGHVLTRRLPKRQANVAAFDRTWRVTLVQSLAAQLLLLASAIVMFGRRREPVAAMLALAFPLLAFGFYAFPAWIWLDWRLFWPMASAPGGSMLLWAMLVFPDGRLGRWGSWLLAAAILAWIPFMSVLKDTVASWLVLGLLTAAVIARLLIQFRHMPPGMQRQQVRWAVFGMAGFGIISIILTGLRVGILFASTDALLIDIVIRVGSFLTTACLVVGLLISMMRYRLYDADAVIGRSAAYGLLTLGFLALFAGSEKVIEVLGERYFGESLGALAAGIGAALAAVLIVPLHHRVGHWAEHRFQRTLVRLRHGLPLLVGDLRETETPAQIGTAVVRAVVAGVHATRAALLLGDTVVASTEVTSEEVTIWRAANEPIRSEESCRLFPTRVRISAEATGPVGWLLVGERPDGTPIGRDEREALAEIADPIARALHISLERAKRDAGLERRLGVLEDAIAQLLSDRATPLAAVG